MSLNPTTTPATPASFAPPKMVDAEMWTDPNKHTLLVKDFSKFRGLTEDQVKNPDAALLSDPDFDYMRRVFDLIRSSMDYMNSLGRGLPTDSIETLLDITTRKSSRVVLVESKEESQHERTLLGCGIGVYEKEDIPDLKDIPEELKKSEKLARALRLFVNPDAKMFGAEDSMATTIHERVVAEAKGNTIVFKTLYGPDSGPEALHPYWLHSDKVLAQRGAEDCGFAQFKTVRYQDGTEKTLHFKWRKCPATDAVAIAALKSYREYWESLKVWVQWRIARPAAHFKPKNGIYYCLSRENDAHKLASLLQGSLFHDIALDAKTAKERRNTRLKNVDVVQIDPLSGKLEIADGFYSCSALPDLLPRDRVEARKTLKKLIFHQASHLKPGGCITLRSTIAPPSDDKVEIRLITTDGKDSGKAEELSKAACFEAFLSFQPEKLRKEVESLPSDNPAMKRFLAPASLVSHFCIIESYRQYLPKESVRNICPLTQKDIEEVFEDCGLKIVSSAPEFNQWIYESHLDGAVSIHNRDGEKLPWFPTNFDIVAEKPEPSEGYGFRVRNVRPKEKPDYLNFKYYLGQDGRTTELVERPDTTLDLIPWFEHEASYYVLARYKYPRPLTAGTAGTGSAGYMTQPIAAVVDSGLINFDTRDTPSIPRTLIEEKLLERGGAPPELIKDNSPLGVFRSFPAPHLVNEQVISALLQINPVAVLPRPAKSFSGFASAGHARPLEARQHLSACHCGAMQSSRLELMIYNLFSIKGVDPGPWVGGKYSLTPQNGTGLLSLDCARVFSQTDRSFFRPADAPLRRFLQTNEATVYEVDAAGESLAQKNLEFVTPAEWTKLGTNTAAVLPVVKIKNSSGKEEILVGLEIRDSAAAQEHTDSSFLMSLPTFKLEADIIGIRDTKRHAIKRLYSDFSLNARKIWTLGGSYFSSPGVTPELVQPLLADIDAGSARLSNLAWLPLREVLKYRSQIYDPNLLIALFRLAHESGLLRELAAH